MADDPKKPTIPPDPPADKADTAGAPQGPPKPTDGPALGADALSDGTVPTVLAKGETPIPKVSGTKGDRPLGSVYRRADIVTTLITFIAAAAIGALILGAYLYVTRNKAKAPTPKITTLSTTDLSKLGAFFEGNSAGGAGEILTFNSPSYFKGQVAVGADLKVTGAAEVDGPTELSDLTVNKNSTLGITAVRGQLTVTGPFSLQSPATLSDGATITGNLAVSGNGSFGGSLSAGLVSASNLTVLNNLTLAGHIILNGATPTVTVNAGAGTGATATISGTDTAGTVTINTGTIPSSNGSTGAELVQVNFHTAFTAAPVVILTAVGQTASIINPYVVKSAPDFIIGSGANNNVLNPTPVLTSHTSYAFDYWVVQ